MILGSDNRVSDPANKHYAVALGKPAPRRTRVNDTAPRRFGPGKVDAAINASGQIAGEKRAPMQRSGLGTESAGTHSRKSAPNP
jgi:hypothetical protein